MTHAEAILRAAAMLDASGRRELSRKEIRDQLGLTQAQWMRGYTAIFQGMREDQPGGAPSVPKTFRGVFRQIGHGRFVLTDVGRQRILGMSLPQAAASDERRAPSRVQLRTAGLRQVVVYPGEDGYWIAECPACLAASARHGPRRRLSRTSGTRSTCTWRRSSTTTCRFPRSGSRRCSSPYEQAAAGVGPRVRQTSCARGLRGEAPAGQPHRPPPQQPIQSARGTGSSRARPRHPACRQAGLSVDEFIALK